MQGLQVAETYKCIEIQDLERLEAGKMHRRIMKRGFRASTMPPLFHLFCYGIFHLIFTLGMRFAYPDIGVEM